MSQFTFRCGKMKTVLLFAGLVAISLAGTVPKQEYDLKTNNVDKEFVERQYKVFRLLQQITQTLPEAEYFKIGSEYKIEEHLDSYTNKQAVEEFLLYFKNGMLPKGHIFSVFYDQMREEAVALYHLFFYAKDFETFYKTASWARVHLNEGMFTYAFSIAAIHRPDTTGIVLPAPYEIYPYFFINADVVAKLYRIKMQDGIIEPAFAAKYGITFEDNRYNVYANYSGWYSYYNKEQRLSYFTEDIGLNTYYYYFHATFPFWMTSTNTQYDFISERRGEFYFFFHQQLLARYYMERLTNGLGEIPEFSWKHPVQTGFTSNLVHHSLYPFVQRNDYYNLQKQQNIENLEYVESYERQFAEFLEQGHFKSYNWEVDFKNSKSINFVGNYWQSNADLYEKFGPRNYEKYYEIIARVLLGARPDTTDKHFSAPVALEHFETSLRDPVFFQLYKRIMYYFLQYKQYLEPYTREQLDFVGVKINDVKVDSLVTYFDFYDFEGSHGVFYGKEELAKIPYAFRIRQPRLNHKRFNVNIEIKSDISTEASFKIFLAPKYDSEGHLITLEDNWMNFFELDWFKQKLEPGKNTIVRSSVDFFRFKEDSSPVVDVIKMLENGKVPTDMSQKFFLAPNRIMLPKGTKGGYPFQLFVIVYPHVPLTKEVKPFSDAFIDNKPLGYPLDRPINELTFYQTNMFFEDVLIYHEGEDFAYKMNYPGHEYHKNEVVSH